MHWISVAKEYQAMSSFASLILSSQLQTGFDCKWEDALDLCCESLPMYLLIRLANSIISIANRFQL